MHDTGACLVKRPSDAWIDYTDEQKQINQPALQTELSEVTREFARTYDEMHQRTVGIAALQLLERSGRQDDAEGDHDGTRGTAEHDADLAARLPVGCRSRDSGITLQ